jgi:hypothetical protein
MDTTLQTDQGFVEQLQLPLLHLEASRQASKLSMLALTQLE